VLIIGKIAQKTRCFNGRMLTSIKISRVRCVYMTIAILGLLP
jgi:hypothetical protein